MSATNCKCGSQLVTVEERYGGVCNCCRYLDAGKLDPITAAVMPLKTEAMERAKKVAQDFISQTMMDLEVHGWDLNKVAPYPASTLRRPAYMKAKRTRAIYESLTTRVAMADDKPWYNPSRDPNIRAKDEAKCAQFISEAEADAGVQYMAFIGKLQSKVGPDVVEATLQGSHVWGYSTLTVKIIQEIDGAFSHRTERWRTHQIVNISKLGKVFNQWPTRKVK